MLLFMSIASALVTDWSSTVDPDLLSQGLLLGVKRSWTEKSAFVIRQLMCDTSLPPDVRQV
jgi:hypothetical protein